MIKFKGRNYLKQYMPKKLIKRGYKVWMKCAESGYCLDFEIYTGKEGTLFKLILVVRLSDSNVAIIKWKDKRSVFILTNYIDPTKSGVVTRRERNGDKTEVNCPEAVMVYNSCMNYVDKFDQLKILIKRNKPSVPIELRTESNMHQPERTTSRRCAKCSTKNNPARTVRQCSTRKVPLCIRKDKTCFLDFHKNDSESEGIEDTAQENILEEVGDISDCESIHSEHNSASEIEESDDSSDTESAEDTSSNSFYGKNRFKWSKTPPHPSRTRQHNIIEKRTGRVAGYLSSVKIFTLAAHQTKKKRNKPVCLQPLTRKHALYYVRSSETKFWSAVRPPPSRFTV
ncbi:hypothetical protein EVAR_46331_1 [Eumeta japonica]|uniref:PiggyBac transposable element-derived protein domain-containing protein n=1 Tax=Eumeta variegata TaxID=151549 RepID=A0A4C1WYC5_EUMVA|nr:hypothetical protein EVAR_46331_1 [Eumeta japonica]